MKDLIFHASHIYWLFAPICIWVIWRKGRAIRWLAACALIAASVLAYARFVEPRILVVHEATIILPGASDTSPSIRVAVFGDPHYGVYRNAMPMRRIVNRINSETVDAVFVAGDLTYYPTAAQIESELSHLSGSTAPVFAVLGNHDVGFPGPDLTNPVLKALTAAGVTVAHNRAIESNIGGHSIIVAGASDLWQGQQNFDFRAQLPASTPVLLLTHNPDTARVVPPEFAYDIMLAGHTHGGQIRLPGLIQAVIPTEYPFDKELHRVPTPAGERLVYVTTGTGMVGLPMRFNMPPRIEILTLHLPAE